MRKESQLLLDITTDARRIRLNLLALAIRCLKEGTAHRYDREPLPALLNGLAGISYGSGECLSYDEKQEGLEELFALEPWRAGDLSVNQALLRVCNSTSLWVPAFETMFHLLVQSLEDYDKSMAQPGTVAYPQMDEFIGKLKERIMSLRFSHEREIPERGFRPLLEHWMEHDHPEVSQLARLALDAFTVQHTLV